MRNTTVILEGAIGARFGREWNISVSSPRDALRLINANRPGIFHWIRSNLQKYTQYRVICESEDGNISEFNKEQYIGLTGRYSKITFVPVIEGSGSDSGGAFQTILGIVMIIYGIYSENPKLVAMGVATLAGGVASLLTARPKLSTEDRNNTDQKKTSYFFNGPVNTTVQGVPVQLIYGRVLVGSHTISAAVSVDQISEA